MQIHFYDKNAKFRVSFHFFNCKKNVVFVKILFNLIKYIKCTHVRTLDLKSYENKSKNMPSSLWLKKYTFKLNTLYNHTYLTFAKNYHQFRTPPNAISLAFTKRTLELGCSFTLHAQNYQMIWIAFKAKVSKNSYIATQIK